jgi:hypothetical protein
MAQLCEEIERTLLPGMSIPVPLALLFTWIESNRLFRETEDGQQIGFLFPKDAVEEEWIEIEQPGIPGGTIIEFFAEGNGNLKYWFGHDRPEVLNRLCVFAKTGGDGSMAAFWLDDNGNQKIVHLGSGSGSTLVCVLADDPVDFLRLIAIGYEEICRDEKFAKPPNADCSDNELYVYPNVEYQNWVRETFGVTIPQTACEIVRCPSLMGDKDSEDLFCQWVEQNI